MSGFIEPMFTELRVSGTVSIGDTDLGEEFTVVLRGEVSAAGSVGKSGMRIKTATMKASRGRLLADVDALSGSDGALVAAAEVVFGDWDQEPPKAAPGPARQAELDGQTALSALDGRWAPDEDCD